MIMTKDSTRLANGAEVLKVRESQNDEGFIVLAHTGGDVHPFVTWRVDHEGNGFWGHYFSNEREAENDFIARTF